MSVALDVRSNPAAGNAGALSWTHTPTGTPRGVTIYVYGDEGTDDVTTVTYGGVTVPEVSGSPLLHTGGEICAVHAFHLGAGIPTGPQTVAIGYRSGGTSFHNADCVTETAAADTAVEDTKTVNSNSLANPSATLVIDENSFILEGIFSGQDAVGGITPLAGWTSQREIDWGTQTSGLYTKDANAAVNTAAGWTQTADDAIMIAIAVKESSSGTTLTMPLLTNANTLYVPTITTGPVSISPPLITNTSVLYTPSIFQLLTTPLIASTNVLYPPSLTVGPVTVTMPLLTNSNTLYTPTVTRGPVSVAPPLLTNTNVLYAPSLIYVVSMPFISSVATAFSPNIFKILLMPFLTNSNTLYTPRVRRLNVPLTGWRSSPAPQSDWRTTAIADANWRKEATPTAGWH